MQKLQPHRKILTAQVVPSMQTLDKIMKQRINPEKDISLDVHADIVIRDGATKKIVDKRRFRCESFVANFLKILAGKFLQAPYSMSNIVGIVHPGTEVEFINAADLFLISDVAAEFPFMGPVVGTGTTAPTPNDYKLEEQLTHGSEPRDLTAASGTCGAPSSTIVVYDSGAPGWSADEWNGYFIEITSGALNGEERYIFDTLTNYVYLYLGYPWSRKQELPGEPDGLTYLIKTYGQLTHGSVGISAPIDDGDVTSTFTITRTFTNSTGGSVDVTEFGLYANMLRSISTYINSSYLLIRDVAEAATILNGQEMTLTYTFTVVA